MTIRVRNETAADAASIEMVTVAAFQDAPYTDHTEQFIVKALREAGQLSVSLVAEDKGRIVGHVAISPVPLSSGEGRWYGLGPISVLPKRQGQGIGSLLVERGFEKLRGLGAAGCVVLGEPSYYSRFGFKVAPSLVLPGVPPTYFQAISFTGPVPAGTVAYPEAFAARA